MDRWTKINGEALDVLTDWLDSEKLTADEEQTIFESLRRIKQERLNLWKEHVETKITRMWTHDEVIEDWETAYKEIESYYYNENFQTEDVIVALMEELGTHYEMLRNNEVSEDNWDASIGLFGSLIETIQFMMDCNL